MLFINFLGTTSDAPKCSNLLGEENYSSKNVDEKKDTLSKKRRRGEKAPLHEVEGHNKWRNDVKHNDLHGEKKSERFRSQIESNGLHFEERGTKKVSKKRKREKKS